MSSVEDNTLVNHTIILSDAYILNIYFDLFSNMPIKIINIKTNIEIRLGDLYIYHFHHYKHIYVLFAEYIQSFMTPLELVETNIEYESRIIKIKLKQHQSYLVNYCVTKENSSSNFNKHYTPPSLLGNITVITGDNQTGKSFIPLELSAYNVDTELENVLQTTLVVVPSFIKEQWKTKLTLYYLNNYYIIDSVTKLNAVVKDNIINFELIKDCKLILIESAYFNDFMFYIKESNIYFSRVVYDSFFNINNITTLYPEHFINTYIITNQPHKLLTYNNIYTYPYLEGSYDYITTFQNECYNDDYNINELSIYTKLLCELYDNNELYEQKRNNEIKLNDVIKNNKRDKINVEKLIAQLVNQCSVKLIEEIKELQIQIDYGIDSEESITSEMNIIINTLSVKRSMQLDTILYLKDINKKEIPYYEFDITLYKCNKYDKDEFTNTERMIENLFTKGPSQFANIIDEEATLNIIITNNYINKGIVLLDETKAHIKERVTYNECPVCLCSISNKIVTSCCHNSFCLKCYLLSINSNKTCPCCREPFTYLRNHYIIEQNMVSYSEEKQAQNILDNTTLFNIDTIYYNIFKLIKLTNKSPKSLIIYSGDINVYSKVLIQHRMSYVVFNNKTCVDNIVKLNMFINTDMIDCLLININHYATFIEYGFNLINIDYIIYHNFMHINDKMPHIVNNTGSTSKKIKYIRVM